MKKILLWIIGILGAFEVLLFVGTELELVTANGLLIGGMVVLFIAAAVYAIGFGGIPCPHCGCRINPKYARMKAFEGHFACPNCGTMIER